ncbi:hypothetical protein WL35_01040 [Burkholderia ubonensis]|nr:hypothetical protein WI83_29210 [Burkholderia ubonensis]KVD66892.1 hypothetical protein WI86_21445 [Burkholderia ubonensis]KVD71886.1 hypothetical protein WI89_01330 [Burkholderia ubonensis]KVU66363.1 hypothetical protein WK71_19430 [Burkholderia ubonensis]KVX14338.1 hypothetical protein WL02_20690 [Burkholderia ubonensis]
MIMTISQRDECSGDAQALADEIREGAVRWLLWLRAGDATARELDAFRRWRMRSAEHARTAHELIWLWAVLGMLGQAEPDGSTQVH